MKTVEELKKQLLEIVKSESVSIGEFILASGKKSNFYIDMRRTSLHPMGAKLIGEIIFKKIKHLDFDCIGGPTLGADPIVSAVSIASALSETPVPGFYVRK